MFLDIKKEIKKIKILTKFDIGTNEVMDGDLSQRSVIFDFGLSNGGAVVRNEDELGGTISNSLDGRLVTEGSLTGSHDQSELGLDVILSDLLDHFCLYVDSVFIYFILFFFNLFVFFNLVFAQRSF